MPAAAVALALTLAGCSSSESPGSTTTSASLDATQTTAATLSGSSNDILLGPGKDWAFPTTSEGLVGSELTADQKATLLAAIATSVDVDDADAATILAGSLGPVTPWIWQVCGSPQWWRRGGGRARSAESFVVPARRGRATWVPPRGRSRMVGLMI
ncbi:hypothetical protein ACL02T_32850 [Pseudonocardia sp. RS010]|uniref:hypothetical protein n=1 Tax=Pseudonocardia sp. RS010 TaxID=3385979 RepID=UPI0039A3628B